MKPQTNTTPLQVNHTGLFPSVTVSFNMKNGASFSDATREVAEMEQGLGMPVTIQGFFAGTAQAYQQSMSTLPILVITALLSVFIVLGILYESLIHPLTIISTVFSASAGAMLALMLFHIDLNMISIIGIILLIGIVKKNAIMMIDFALQAERNEGKSTRDAIFEACMLRFRPIMMTTMCGHLRSPAAGLRNRHRLGAAQASGHHHCGRTAFEPGAHAVHHPCGLPDDGPPPPSRAGPDSRRASLNGRRDGLVIHEG